MASLQQTPRVVEHRGWSVTLRPARGRIALSVKLPLRRPHEAHARGVLALPAPLTLRPRTPDDERGVGLGVNRALRTGYPEVDSALYVESDAPAADLTAMLADPEVRRALVGHLKAERAEVQLIADAAEATLSLDVPAPATWELADAQRHALLELLALLAARLPPFRPGTRPLRASVTEGLSVLGILSPMAGGFGALGAILAWPVFAGWEHYALLALVGLLGTLLSWPVMLLACRGVSRGWPSFKVFVVCTLLGGPLTALGVGRFVNCALDPGPVRTHVVEVVDTRSSYSAKSGTHYTLVVRSWRPGGGTEELASSGSLNSEAQRAKRVTVRTRPGALGAEWLVGIGPTAGER